LAREAVRAAFFHPKGERGLQPFVRAASYRDYPTAEFLDRANEEVVLVVHIEGRQGVEQFEEIAQVDGVDVAFLGPYDLSQSLGIPGMVQSPMVRQRMRRVIEQAKQSGVAVGTFCDDVRTAAQWRKLGVTYLAVGLDAGIFLSAAKRMVSQLKQE